MSDTPVPAAQDPAAQDLADAPERPETPETRETSETSETEGSRDLSDGAEPFDDAARGVHTQAAFDGALAGLAAAGLGVGIAVAPVLAAVVADALAGGFGDPGGILRTAGQIWLAAHRVGLDVAGDGPDGSVRLGIVPLGVTVPVLVVLVRAGRRCAGPPGGEPREPKAALVALGACTAVYAALAYLAAVVAATPAIQPVRERAPVAAATAVAVAGAYGLLRAGAFRTLPDRLPPSAADRLRPYAVPARAALRAGTAAACALACGGALIVVASLLRHGGDVTRLADRVAQGAPDMFALALLCVALLPNAVVCAVAYASGAGFAVGVGTTVAPTAVSLGAVPALPLLGTLPTGTSTLGWCTTAVPAAAGIVAGLVAARGVPAGRLGTAVGAAALSGPVAGLFAAAAAWLATGAAGAHRLTRVGPHVWTTAGLVAAEIAVVATVVALAAAWQRWRTVRAAAQVTTAVVTVPGQGAHPTV